MVDRADGKEQPRDRWTGLTELIRAVGGALLAFVGVVALVSLTLLKLDDLAEASRGEAFVAVVGAISTVVGGYVGVKVGATGKDEITEQRKDAERKKDLANRDVAMLLAKLPPDEADAMRPELHSLQ